MREGLTRVALFCVLAAAGCKQESASAPASAPQPVAAHATGAGVEAAGLHFELPDGWQRVTPSSAMRLVQASIPGDAGAGELAVFHFGAGQGGAVDANLARWIAQMELAPGVTPRRETFESNGMHITWIDVAGTLKAGQMGMGPGTAQPNSRLLGAVIEGKGGPWFLKATGPDATLSAQRDGFLAMLRSAR